MPVLDRAELELYIYDGTSGSYTDSDLRYELSKTRISSQDNIIFEISELVRDYIDLTFNDDYLSKTKWVSAITRLYDADGEEFASGSPVTNHYLAMRLSKFFRLHTRRPPHTKVDGQALPETTHGHRVNGALCPPYLLNRAHTVPSG